MGDAWRRRYEALENGRVEQYLQPKDVGLPAFFFWWLNQPTDCCNSATSLPHEWQKRCVVQSAQPHLRHSGACDGGKRCPQSPQNQSVSRRRTPHDGQQLVLLGTADCCCGGCGCGCGATTSGFTGACGSAAGTMIGADKIMEGAAADDTTIAPGAPGTTGPDPLRTCMAGCTALPQPRQ